MPTSPRIVVLDGHTLNPGDLDWESLKKLGRCEIYERTPEPEILRRARESEIVLTNKTPLNSAAIEALPKLRYIGVLATGYNIVDTAAAQKRGIPVTNVPAYGTRSVAQMTFALILELAHHVGPHSDSVRAGVWSRNPDFCYWNYPLIELAGLSLGIVGFGRIGKTVAVLGAAFGMEVRAYGPRLASRPVKGASFCDLQTLFESSDILSLHCPLTPETKELINAGRLALMKRSAFLINTARGGLVDEAALARVLAEGGIAGAALDVLSTEPPDPKNPLLSAPNCLITPHIAWATRAARRRLLNGAVENLAAFLAGNPKNIVNEVWRV